MTRTPPRFDPARAARTAGALYLVIIVCGIWSEVFARAPLIAPGDAAATAANILAAPMLFRLSIAADALMALSDVALAVLLYLLLRHVNPVLALMAMAFRLIQTAIIGAGLTTLQEVPLILDAGGSAEAVLLRLDTHAAGYDTGLIFFGVACLMLANLLCHSGAVPKLLAGGIAASGLVYLTGSALSILAPGLSGMFQIAYLIPLLAETALCLWLLLRGLGGPVAATA